MLKSIQEHGVVDEQTIDLIAQRVIAAIRDDLNAIAAELSISPQATEQLTVGQVARRLGVARSTVYAHWREWGGYKLSAGDKAPIRFDSTALPIARISSANARPADLDAAPRRRSKRQHRRRDLLVDAPRLARQLDGIA